MLFNPSFHDVALKVLAVGTFGFVIIVLALQLVMLRQLGACQLVFKA